MDYRLMFFTSAVFAFVAGDHLDSGGLSVALPAGASILSFISGLLMSAKDETSEDEEGEPE